TDGALAQAGLDFDQVTLTNFEELAPDTQDDNCIAIIAVAPFALAVDPTGNKVLDPFAIDESFVPSWQNTGNTAVTLTGTLSNFTGPGAGVDVLYEISDSTANYGSAHFRKHGSRGADCHALQEPPRRAR